MDNVDMGMSICIFSANVFFFKGNKAINSPSKVPEMMKKIIFFNVSLTKIIGFMPRLKLGFRKEEHCITINANINTIMIIHSFLFVIPLVFFVT